MIKIYFIELVKMVVRLTLCWLSVSLFESYFS